MNTVRIAGTLLVSLLLVHSTVCRASDRNHAADVLSRVLGARINCFPSRGRWPRHSDLVPHWKDIKIEVLIRGRSLPLRRQNGELYLPLKTHGDEYVLRIENCGRGRVLVAVSIDGLSIMDGKPVTNDARSGGYIFEPRATHVLRGWRNGDNKVAAFSFQPAEKSFAAQSGQTANVGCIRMLVFEEKPEMRRPQVITGGYLGSSRSATFSSPRSIASTGTGRGRELVDRVRRVPFRRGRVRQVTTLRYGLERSQYPTVEPDTHVVTKSAGNQHTE